MEESQVAKPHRELFKAIRSKDLELVKQLVQNKADCNKQGLHETTPLLAACFHGFYESIPLLLEHSADINLCNRFRETPVHLCAQKNNFPCLESLLRHGGEIEGPEGLCDLLAAQDRWGATPLHLAIRHGSAESVIAIGKHCRDLCNLLGEEIVMERIINVQDEEGDTPLHEAVRLGNREVVCALLEFLPHPLIENKEGRTPIELIQTSLYDSANDEVEFLLTNYLSTHQKPWRRVRISEQSPVPENKPQPKQLHILERITLMKPPNQPLSSIKAIFQGRTMSSQKMMCQEDCYTNEELENLLGTIACFFDNPQIPPENL